MNTTTEQQWIIVTGDPIIGFKYYGPFNDSDIAVRFGEDKGATDWWLVTLYPAK